jgi:hypothetical protein
MIVQMSSLFKNHNPCAGYAADRYANKIVLNKQIVGYMINILEKNPIKLSRLGIQHMNLS